MRTFLASLHPTNRFGINSLCFPLHQNYLKVDGGSNSGSGSDNGRSGSGSDSGSGSGSDSGSDSGSGSGSDSQVRSQPVFSGKPEGPFCLSYTFFFRNERNWMKKSARVSEKLVSRGLPGLQVATRLIVVVVVVVL